VCVCVCGIDISIFKTPRLKGIGGASVSQSVSVRAHKADQGKDNRYCSIWQCHGQREP
jgi:hypothetical protein